SPSQWSSCFCSPGKQRGGEPWNFPMASRSRGFFVSGGEIGSIRATADRAQVAAGLGGRAGVLRLESRVVRRGGTREVLHARDSPVSIGKPAYGPRAQLHARRRGHALPAPARLHGLAADGLRLVRPP